MAGIEKLPLANGNITNTAALAAAITDRSGVIDMKTKIEAYVAPDTTTITIEGRNSADSADAQNEAYLFNKGLGSATTGKPETYDDGNGGALIDRHIMLSNYTRGMNIKRITFTGINADGNQDPTVLQRVAFTVLGLNSNGGVDTPYPMNIAKALRNTQNQSGQVTVDVDIWVNGISKVKVTVPAGCQLTILVEWAQN